MARTIVGTVVSDKADKTIVLSETVRKTHPLYKKQYSRGTKYVAHDEKNEANIGDLVEVKQVRPISKRKTLTLVKIVKRARIAAKDTVDSVTSGPVLPEDVKEEDTTKKVSSKEDKK